MPPRKGSTADLGSRDNTLTLLESTPEIDAEKARLASLLLGRQPDGPILKQMLGLQAYDTAVKQRNTTPLLHGRRATYVNRGCRCTGCVEANTAYLRDYNRTTA